MTNVVAGLVMGAVALAAGIISFARPQWVQAFFGMGSGRPTLVSSRSAAYLWATLATASGCLMLTIGVLGLVELLSESR